MHYRIEYLKEPTDSTSVCHVRSLRGADLLLAQLQAMVWSVKARTKFSAMGYQLRDLTDNGRIVALEEFDGPPPCIH